MPFTFPRRRPFIVEYVIPCEAPPSEVRTIKVTARTPQWAEAEARIALYGLGHLEIKPVRCLPAQEDFIQ